jgi:DNA-directed RNA polymerase specialized sigma24 family protein
MIYTCYDMVRDCRDGRDAGWLYFVSNYTPVIRRIVAHYRPENAPAGLVERLLVAMRQPQSPLFQSHDPAPERWFVAEMRQLVLGVIDELPSAAEPEPALDLPLLDKALEGLTVVEKQAVWLETMRYAPKETATLLRMEPRTVEKIRDRAADLLRGALDTWRRTLLVDNGRQLGRLAGASRTPDCSGPKAFLDVLDGRSTWQRREELERHVTGCWYCIDHFCRMAEVLELLRGIEPLPEEEAGKLLALLGIDPPKKTLWKRWFAAR